MISLVKLPYDQRVPAVMAVVLAAGLGFIAPTIKVGGGLVPFVLCWLLISHLTKMAKRSYRFFLLCLLIGATMGVCFIKFWS